MNDVTHSPSPWRLDLNVRFSAGRSNREFGYGDYGGIYDAKGKPVVGCDEYDVFWGRHREANARLIAAAPDMLAALKRVIAVADRATDEFDAARAAVAKAEGGEPADPR